MKKFIVLCLVLTLLLTLSASALATNFSDITNHPERTTLQRWANEGLIQGFPDGTFRPGGDITRAEFSALIMRAFNFNTTSAIDFSDVAPGAWYYEAVALGVGEGFILGFPDGTFRPNDPITREQGATILARIAALTPDPNETATFRLQDSSDLTWSRGAVSAVLQHGIMRPIDNNRFRPQQNLTRADAVVSLDAVKARQTATDSRRGWMAITGGEFATGLGINFTFTVENDLGAPINGATVLLGDITRTTNNAGQAVFSNQLAGTSVFVVSAAGFRSETGSTAVSNAINSRRITLTYQGSGYRAVLIVQDRDNDNAPLAGARVELTGNASVESDSEGRVEFSNLPPGVYTFRVTYNNNEATGTITVGRANPGDTVVRINSIPPVDDDDDDDDDGDDEIDD